MPFVSDVASPLQTPAGAEEQTMPPPQPSVAAAMAVAATPAPAPAPTPPAAAATAAAAAPALLKVEHKTVIHLVKFYDSQSNPTRRNKEVSEACVNQVRFAMDGGRDGWR